MSLRTKVFAAFRNVHRARMQVFAGDHENLSHFRENINTEFKKNKTLEDDEKINELVSSANEVATWLRTNIVQAELNEDTGAYKVKITKDTKLEDNAPFLGGDNAPPSSRSRKRKNKPCGS